MCSEMLCSSSSSGSLPVFPSALFLGRLTSRIAPRDARRAVIFATSRPRAAPSWGTTPALAQAAARKARLSSRPWVVTSTSRGGVYPSTYPLPWTWSLEGASRCRQEIAAEGAGRWTRNGGRRWHGEWERAGDEEGRRRVTRIGEGGGETIVRRGREEEEEEGILTIVVCARGGSRSSRGSRRSSRRPSYSLTDYTAFDGSRAREPSPSALGKELPHRANALPFPTLAPHHSLTIPVRPSPPPLLAFPLHRLPILAPTQLTRARSQKIALCATVQSLLQRGAKLGFPKAPRTTL